MSIFIGGSVPIGTTAGTAAAGNDSRITKAVQQSVANRSPGASDDVNSGYSVGDLWVANKLAWKALRVSAGQAVWATLPICNTLPLDTAPGLAVAAYGMRLLRAAYAGSAMDVVRASDGTTKTIGFVNNGTLDTVALDAFLANTTGAVSKWYDQSGNGNDAVQATTVNQPTIGTNSVSGTRAISFNSVEAGPPGGQIAKYMTIPTTAAFIPMSAGLFAVGQTRSATMTSAFGSVGPANDAVFLASSAPLPHPGLAVNGGLSSVTHPTSPSVTVFTQNLGVASVFVQNTTQDGFNTGRSGAGVAGGALGASVISGVGPGEFDATALIFINSNPTASQVTNIRAALLVQNNIAPQVTDVWVADGDSITNGFGSTTLSGYPRRALDMLQAPLKQFNIGVHGITLAIQMTKLAANYGTIYSASARNFVVTLLIGTNDISAGATALTIYTNLQTYIGGIKAFGANVRVAVATLLPRTGLTGPQATELVSYNALIQAHWSQPVSAGGLGADALIGLTSDPTMGPGTAPVDVTLYADGLHPTDLGYTYLAPIAAATVQSLLV